MTPAGSRWAGLAQAPVQVAGVINAYCALLAQRAGFPALYLSGSGVATASFGLPDLALTTLTEVAEETRRITAATQLPLLVDADTGWGPAVDGGTRGAGTGAGRRGRGPDRGPGRGKALRAPAEQAAG